MSRFVSNVGKSFVAWYARLTWKVIRDAVALRTAGKITAQTNCSNECDRFHGFPFPSGRDIETPAGKVSRIVVNNILRGRFHEFFTSTFELRPLASYFSRRPGGRSSGVPSAKPPLD